MFIAKLEASAHKLHNVCISVDKQTIFDCRKSRPLRLSTSALKSCLGDQVSIYEIKEIWRVELYESRASRLPSTVSEVLRNFVVTRRVVNPKLQVLKVERN